MASTQAHEVGHNLGLQHASEVDPILGPDEYGDDTGLMGNGIFTDDAKLCYNPAKSWQLGWYSLRRKLLDFTQEGKFTGQLIGVNDYKHSSAEGKYVNIKIEHPGSNKEIYVGFNLATGINSETPEAPNLVTVQAQASNGHSWLLAKLDSGNNHQHKIPNFIGTGTLNIDVKSINLGASPPVADVEIFMEYTAECNDDSACKHLEACAIGTCQQGFCLYDTSTCPGNFLLQLATDTYPSELTWSVEDLCRDIPAVVLHGGPYWVPNSEIVELGTLGQSRFQFTMKDSKGNGLSNATSPATHFNVSFNGFPVMQIGDDFGFSATFEFGLKSCAQQLLGPITSSTMPITTTSPPPKAVAIRKATKSKAKKPKAAKKNAKKRTRQ